PAAAAAPSPAPSPTEGGAGRTQRRLPRRERIPAEENAPRVGRSLDGLVAEHDGRKDADTRRISGRAEDNRLVHLALPADLAEEDLPRPGDMVTATVTGSAPHHLIADSGRDGGQFLVRRTRAGQAWQQRRSTTHTHPTGPAEGPVSLGMPTLRPGTPAS